MKKVLILSVIAMLALSVMALASTANAHVLSYNPYGSANKVQAGPTCSSSSLTVYSVIGIEQGFVATATSYDASFCGATGDPLTSAYISGSLANVLASLSVESNMATITVGVSYTLTGPTGDLTGDLSGLNPSNNSSQVLPLTDGSLSTPWSGTLKVIGPSHIQQWVAAGDYKLATTFTITPQNTF